MYKVALNESYVLLDRYQRERIIASIYQKELALFGVDEKDAELVRSEDFWAIYTHTCFNKFDLHPQANQFQLIYALVQQVNESPDNIVH